MSDQENSRRKGIDVAIVVAIITFIGTVMAAVITNSEKLFGAHPTPSATQGPVVTAPSYPANMDPLELRTDRHGEDFSLSPEHTEGPVACAQMCSALPACKAMTYVLSPNGLPAGDCWLKKAAPTPSARSDMTSSLKNGP
ncbi:MAG: PAN domain-containing protein [Pseudomonadota bacterium]